MENQRPGAVARAVTRAVLSRAAGSVLLLALSAPCCLWAALRALERGMPELWSAAPMAGFVPLAASVWLRGRARWTLALPAAGILAAVYLILR